MARSLALILIVLSAFMYSCNDGGGLNLFTIEDDKMLGLQLRDTIFANPNEYPVMAEAVYPSQYAYIRGIVDEILASGKVKYADEFNWEIYLIDEPEVLNAFASPGGYMFVYSGLIKYLDQKDDLVGVIGHEMAHADRRHSTTQLTKTYGVATLLSVLLGEDNELISNVLTSLVALKFSRNDESDADEQSVIYLCETQYAANGAASFFEKLEEQGSINPPEFLSTHPSHDTRIADIHMAASDLSCDTTFDSNLMDWQAFQASLP